MDALEKAMHLWAKEASCYASVLRFPFRDCPYKTETNALDLSIFGDLRFWNYSDEFLSVSYESQVIYYIKNATIYMINPRV